MLSGSQSVHQRLRYLKVCVIVCLCTLFVVAVARKKLQLTDLVCLLFTIFSGHNRHDAIAYQVTYIKKADTYCIVLVFTVHTYHTSNGPLQSYYQRHTLVNIWGYIWIGVQLWSTGILAFIWTHYIYQYYPSWREFWGCCGLTSKYPYNSGRILKTNCIKSGFGTCQNGCPRIITKPNHCQP
jgi:hypothetical protein